MSNYISVFKKKDQSSSENSKLAGSDMDQENLSFIPGMKKEIKLIKMKFYVLLLLSNIMIAFIASHRDEGVQPEEQKVQLITHPDHTKIKLSLDLRLKVKENQKEIPITLYDSHKKQIIVLAYLHPLPKEREAGRDFMDQEEGVEYEVEIQNNELKKIIQRNESTFIAYPYSPKIKEKVLTQKRRMPYEIQF